MSEIYVIEGNCGEYSDRCNWLVKAFSNEKDAIEFRDKLESLMEKHGFNKGCNYPNEIGRNEVRELDPQFRQDYTGTYYALHTLELA